MTQRTNLFAGTIAAASILVLGACGGSSAGGPGFDGLSPKKAQTQLDRADRALFDNPYDSEALVDRAEALAALGRQDSAMDDAVAATELDPASTEASEMVEKLEQAGAQRPARAAVRVSTETEPADEPQDSEQAQADQEPSEELASTITEEPDEEPTPPAPPVEDLLARADEQIAQGERALALATLIEAIELHPESAAAYRKRAWLHLGDGYLDAAMDDLDQSLAIDPGSAAGHELRGYTAVRMERDEIAEASLTRAIELDTATPNRLLYLGIARTRLKHDGAADALELALSMGGEDWQHRDLASRWLQRARSNR